MTIYVKYYTNRAGRLQGYSTSNGNESRLTWLSETQTKSNKETANTENQSEAIRNAKKD